MGKKTLGDILPDLEDPNSFGLSTLEQTFEIDSPVGTLSPGSPDSTRAHQPRISVPLASPATATRAPALSGKPHRYSTARHIGVTSDPASGHKAKAISKKRRQRRRAPGRQGLYREIYRGCVKPTLLVLYNKHSFRGGFRSRMKQVLGCDTLQGILLALRQLPRQRPEILKRLQDLQAEKRQLIREGRKVEYSQALNDKLVTMLELLGKAEIGKKEFIKTFLRAVTNAGNTNHTRNDKDIAKYSQLEARFLTFLANPT